MPRTEFAAQFVLKVGRFDVETLLDIGIQLFFVGREHDGYAFVGKFVGVLLQGARVFVEILTLPELQAVDEYADNNVVGAFLASRTRARWPSCRLPIVGTKATLPAFLRHSRNSLMV